MIALENAWRPVYAVILEETVIGDHRGEARRRDSEGRQAEVAGQVRGSGRDALCLEVGTPAVDAHPRGVHPAKPLILAVSLRVPAHLREEGSLEWVSRVLPAAIAGEGALVRVSVETVVRGASGRPACRVRRHGLPKERCVR